MADYKTITPITDAGNISPDDLIFGANGDQSAGTPTPFQMQALADWAVQNGTGGGTPGGADTQIQFNDGGAFGGDADLKWDNIGKSLQITGIGELNTGHCTLGNLATVGDLTNTDLGTLNIAETITSSGNAEPSGITVLISRDPSENGTGDTKGVSWLVGTAVASTHNIGRIVGTDTIVSHNGTGTITSMVAAKYSMVNGSPSAIPGMAFFFDPPNGDWTNYTHLELQDPLGFGATFSGTARNIWSKGATSLNEFEGQIYLTGGALVKNVATLVDGASVPLDASTGNIFMLTAAGNRTIAAPTNPTDGQEIRIGHIASGGARTLSLDTGTGGFRFGTDITALTATASGKTDYVGAVYRGDSNTWDVVAYVKGY